MVQAGPTPVRRRHRLGHLGSPLAYGHTHTPASLFLDTRRERAIHHSLTGHPNPRCSCPGDSGQGFPVVQQRPEA